MCLQDYGSKQAWSLRESGKAPRRRWLQASRMGRNSPSRKVRGGQRRSYRFSIKDREAAGEQTQSPKNQPACPRAQSFMSRGCRIQKQFSTGPAIPLPTKLRLVKAKVFPVVMYGCESWTVKKAECWRIDAFELWCWKRLLKESPGLQGDPISPF